AARLRDHRRVGGEDRPLRDRARGAEDRRLRRRDRRPPRRGVHVRPAGAGGARDRLRHPHPAVPAGNEVPAERREDRRRGAAHGGGGLSAAGRGPQRTPGDTGTPNDRGPRDRMQTARTRATDSEDAMADKKTFHLPDLGEGLPDATIVEWFVKVGDTIRLDENLVSMETAKAVVEVPSPVSGKVLRLAGGPGDVIPTGSMLAEFEIDPSLPQRAEGQDTGHHHGGGHGVGSQDPAPDDRVVASDEGGAIEEEGAPAPKPAGERADSGTVVGAMQTSDAVHTEQAVAVGGVRAMPAVRAQARKLKVDITRVRGTGPDGTVTMADVKRAAAEGSAPAGATRAAAPAPAAPAPAPAAA